MRTGLAVVVALVAAVVVTGCGDENLSFCDGCGTPTPTPTLTASPTPTSTIATPTPIPTLTPLL